jgi:prepilin-type N-terminal cleavage/methylation domain-containing protein
MKKAFTLIELLVTIAIIAVVILLEKGIYDWGRYFGKKEIKSEAVLMGVARWAVTDENGSTEFRWNSPKAANACMDTNGVLAYLKATNEFGVLEMRWTPPVKSVPQSVNTNVSVSTNGIGSWLIPNDSYILKLRDSKTGKDVEVVIPVYSNNVILLNAPCSR